MKNVQDLYHDNGRKVFMGREVRPVHDCRHEIMKNHTDPKEYETWLLAHGLTETSRALASLHIRSKPPTAGSKKGDKLLYKLGAYGNPEGEFNYPRGVCITMAGSILIADTNNHHIQQFTQFGVFMSQFGKCGVQPGEFQEPCDVIELPNGDIAVADSKNSRVQIFTDMFVYKHHIDLPGPGLPYSLSCSREMDVVAATTKRKLYIFNAYERELKRSFSVGSKSKSKCIPVHVSVTYDSKVIVSDPEDGCIYIYTLNAELLSSFTPEAHTPGLAIVVGGVCVTPCGDILVADVLNHVVNLYTDTGVFLQQVLTPHDGVGTLHSLALGPDGHLAVTEFSVGGDHCVKVFRFYECRCHGDAVPARKRRSIVAASLENDGFN
ncbi:unnamed protein product [Candidula unifasciata]|uniref:Uncharacterized protein n=1 Tax=Candidula unifasciata TaxID=100452 RepID=A0A8S3YWS4_9EUPU|nr:unnamed protein product [Candidula unifasciata]